MQLSLIVILDTSASMGGTNLPALRDGYDILLHLVKNNLKTCQNIRLSVLTYESNPTVHCRGGDLADAPGLLDVKAEGLSNLGKALTLFADWIEEDSQDAAILAFLLTDGPGTDDWREQCHQLRQLHDRFLVIGIHTSDAYHFSNLCELNYEVSISDMSTRVPLILQREESMLISIFNHIVNQPASGEVS